MSNPIGRLLKVDQVSLLLNVKRQTLWNWIKKGKIKAVVLPSGCYRIPESEVRVETILKKFKDKDFARGSDRDRIIMFDLIGLKKEKLFEISLKALQGISSELGL